MQQKNYKLISLALEKDDYAKKYVKIDKYFYLLRKTEITYKIFYNKNFLILCLIYIKFINFFKSMVKGLFLNN